MGKEKRRRCKINLTAGRPPIHRSANSISRKATRTLINQIHRLEKRRKRAAQDGEKSAESAIASEILALGGIDKYQEASLQGQRSDRGGDSSKILLEWLRPIEPEVKAVSASRRLRMLEVGALSTNNACSRSRLFDMEHIDLKSRGAGILQQDLMDRPLPRDESERFDILSLSLVLNFVPEARERGEMLLRTLSFLQKPARLGAAGTTAGLKRHFPSLFLVLPAPCVSNSRYLDEERLAAIMSSLGLEMTRRKVTQKLVYYLWTRTVDRSPFLAGEAPHGKKEQVRAGASRNNFAIVLKAPSNEAK